MLNATVVSGGTSVEASKASRLAVADVTAVCHGETNEQMVLQLFCGFSSSAARQSSLKKSYT